jgi:Leucine-rich repeat (LRR) protein
MQQSRIFKKNLNNQKWINLMVPDKHILNGKRLAIRGKNLTQLDTSIFTIDLCLTSLEISPDYQSCLYYKLERLPSLIGNLIHLRELKLDSNDLTSIPSEMSNLINLERLSLSNNLLKSLPDSLSSLINLRSIHLAHNLFYCVPNCLTFLLGLYYLDLTSNKITKLDASLTRLKRNLTFISLFDNRLLELESWISDMNRLSELWLGQNMIRVLPYDLTKIVSLDWKENYHSIILEGNPLEIPPLEVCKQGFSSIKNWYDNSIYKESNSLTSNIDF